MKAPGPSIREYTISDVSADSGRENPARDFHVVRSEELPQSEKMFRPSRSLHFTIVLVYEGLCKIKLNLVDYSLHKHSLFIIPPGAVHQITEITEDCSAILLEFSKEFLSSAELHKKHIDAFSFFSTNGGHQFQITKSEFDLLFNLMLLLRERDLGAIDHPFRQEVIMHGFNLFMFEMAAVIKKYRESGIERFTRKEDLVMKFIKLLALHFKEERSVQYYADQLFVTARHLSKTVKEITDKTCGEMIDEMVITEAKFLLNDFSYSVGNVADELHFSDQFFFSKFFKKHTGKSPTEFKASL